MSGSNAYSPARDLTHKQAKTGGGMDTRVLFIRCQHKGHRGGAEVRAGLALRCAACVAKGKA